MMRIYWITYCLGLDSMIGGDIQEDKLDKWMFSNTN